MLNLRNMFKRTGITPITGNNIYTFQRMGLFGKLRERYDNLRGKKNVEEVSDDEGQDIGFKKFTSYLLERNSYRWKDYELQIEVSSVI
jgi:hypothetical protein